MRTIIKQIPNTITCLNLLAGCMACVVAFYGEYGLAAYVIALAAVFDFADGFAARFLNAYSPLGKELDSLADMVSFGLAPAIMLFSFLAQHDFLLALVAFLLTIFSALRLAKFNIDKRQTDSFIGLPTPANAFFWAFLLKDAHSLPVFDEEQMRIVSHSVHIGDFSLSYFLFFIIIIVLIG
ncbi:MAG: CDP-diacylglycerol--serine O-phosphatidyltransferase, partial [Prevotellaceae bacterium]|nr:CDP-diacylglycerol--serine O-phosphatidyltransferase [Prevotellaceae bacterium]